MPPVLVIDDDVDIRESIAEVLGDAGYKVITAQDGSVALQRLQEAETLPCVILLDMMMPVMDGREFRNQQLKDARLANIPVVVITAFLDCLEEAVELHPAGIVPKPLTPEVLAAAVRPFCKPEDN